MKAKSQKSLQKKNAKSVLFLLNSGLLLNGIPKGIITKIIYLFESIY